MVVFVRSRCKDPVDSSIHLSVILRPVTSFFSYEPGPDYPVWKVTHPRQRFGQGRVRPSRVREVCTGRTEGAKIVGGTDPLRTPSPDPDGESTVGRRDPSDPRLSRSKDVLTPVVTGLLHYGVSLS